MKLLNARNAAEIAHRTGDLPDRQRRIALECARILRLHGAPERYQVAAHFIFSRPSIEEKMRYGFASVPPCADLAASDAGYWDRSFTLARHTAEMVVMRLASEEPDPAQADRVMKKAMKALIRNGTGLDVKLHTRLNEEIRRLGERVRGEVRRR